jgi:hypothetical protein
MKAVGPHNVDVLLKVATMFFCAGAVFFCQLNLDFITKRSNRSELMYFPNTSFSQTATFGYDNLVADWIWLQTIQYYGQHSLSDRQYKYLGHMFDIITLLSPNFRVAYNFGALLLAHDASDISAADRLMQKGMENNPDDWALPFFRGFIIFAFDNNYRLAAKWFTISSRMPNAPEMPGRFAAFAMQKGNDMQTARALWCEILNKSNNKTERTIAQYYIDKIDRGEIQRKLQHMAEKYYRQNRRRPESLGELVQAGYIKKLPEDPLGGAFYWDVRKRLVLIKGGRSIK